MTDDSDSLTVGGENTRLIGLALFRTGRLSLSYVLDTIQLSRSGGDIIDPLIFSAIVEANVAPIRQDPALQLMYAGLNAPAPDELRRPISVSAVAHSLGLPFETVRRRIGQMARAGHCVVSPRGVTVPSAVLTTPMVQMMAVARYERLKRFYLDLRTVELLPQLEASQANADAMSDVTPVRTVNRLLSEYMMRFIDSVMRRVGDPLAGLILLGLLQANTEHLTLAEQEVVTPIPDHLRKPVSVAAMGKRLNIPAETVRRRILWLEDQGFCRRTSKGFIVPGVVRPGLLGVLTDNVADVNRMFNKLNRLGLLAAWDQEAPPVAKVAVSAA